MISQNDYNKWFLEMIYKHLSDYKIKITDHTQENEEYYIAEIKTHSYNDRSINLSSFGNELTIFCFDTHSHYETHEVADHEKEFLNVKAMIEEIINDEVYFYSVSKNDKITGGGFTYDLQNIKSKGLIKIRTWSNPMVKIIKNA